MASVACPPPAADRQREWAADLSPAARDTLVRWLMCEDCPTVEARDAAALIGNRALGPLDQILVSTPDEWLVSMSARYGRLARRIGEDSARIVDHYLARFDAAVQRRSVLLLGAIGGTQAVAILHRARDSAETRGYSSDVIRTIHATLANLELPSFGGQLSDSTADFLDTVIARRGAGPAWNGNESVTLAGAPFPDDVMLWRRGDSLAFVTAGETGWYVLTLAGVGAAERTERDSIHIRSFPAAPQVAPTDVLLDSLPRTILLSLARTTALRDTARFYRFRSQTDRPIRASIDWPGSATIDLVWEDCAVRSFPGPAGRVGGTVVDHQGNALGGAQVAVPGTLLGTMTNTLGQFTINVGSPGWTGSIRAARLGYQTTDRPAAAGRSGYWMVLRPPGSPPSPFTPQTITNPSPNAATLNVPAGACRLLGLVKTDSTVAAVIARLRVTQP